LASKYINENYQESIKDMNMDEMWAMLELMMAIDEMESFLERHDLIDEVEFDENAWKDGLVENWEDENDD
tara:strand:+ start:1338 stop:1547 length:210 start_codon:yes stop_codon:yes gene_type:complete